MSNLEARFRQAVALHQRGQLADAERIYLEVLRRRPNHFDALHLSGVAALQTGNIQRGVERIGKAIRLNGNIADAHNNLGNGLRAAGLLEQAVASYDKAIALRPDYAEAHNNRGKALRELRRHADSVASFDQAIASRPDFAEAHTNRGNALRALGCLEAAIASYDRAIAPRPNDADTYVSRGNVLQDLKRYQDAVASYDAAIALRPDHAEAHNNRGVALLALDRVAEAVASYDAAIAQKPDFAEAHNNRGNALRELKRPNEAIASFSQAIALKPDYAEAYYNRGNARQDLKRHAEALADHDRAIALAPNHARAHNNRAIALAALDRPADALDSHYRALAIEPAHRYAFGGALGIARKICDWTRTAKHDRDVTAYVTERKITLEPFTLLGHRDDPALHLIAARNFVQGVVPPDTKPLWDGTMWRHDRIRVAYLSADFHAHATAMLMAGMLEIHDRSKFEIIGVCFGPDDESVMRARLIRAFDQFHEVRSNSDLEVARLLNRLEIDIAVDLKGYTTDARPGILAHRPAPIQVSYLGYPGTMGADFIDYVIADPIVLPFDQQPFYSERIVHLPESYQVNDSRLHIDERVPTRAEFGLPDDGFVFCCFNNNYKLTLEVFEIWMRLLRAVDGAVLWLLRDNELAERNMRAAATSRGVDPARLVFADRVRHDEHLARHRLADLFLDTLPYNAHTTASDALWAGLPVLTRRGEAFAGRVAASLLCAVGLPELITDTARDYEAEALRLATDPGRLNELRTRLARNRLTHPLFDTGRFARHIESAYVTMWELWQSGEPPRGFSVQPYQTVGETVAAGQ